MCCIRRLSGHLDVHTAGSRLVEASNGVGVWKHSVRNSSFGPERVTFTALGYQVCAIKKKRRKVETVREKDKEKNILTGQRRVCLEEF